MYYGAGHVLPAVIATGELMVRIVLYQKARKISATTSKVVKVAKTIQYIIHFTCETANQIHKK